MVSGKVDFVNLARYFGALIIASQLAAFPASAMTTDAATILALVTSSPQLTVDVSVPAPGGVDHKTHPYIRLLRNGRPVGGTLDPESASIGRTSDGIQVMAVPLVSGGSGGVFTQIVFAQNGERAKPFFAGYITSGGHLAVNIAYHGIVAISPKYGPKDRNCCPSRYEMRTYTIAGHHLEQIAETIGVKP